MVLVVVREESWLIEGGELGLGGGGGRRGEASLCVFTGGCFDDMVWM